MEDDGVGTEVDGYGFEGRHLGGVGREGVVVGREEEGRERRTGGFVGVERDTFHDELSVVRSSRLLGEKEQGSLISYEHIPAI